MTSTIPRSFLGVLLLTQIACSQSTIAQPSLNPEPPPAPAPVQRVGKAEIRYSEKQNRTFVRIYTYVLGTSAEVSERKKEVVTMEIGYSVIGRQVVEPGSLYFRLVSYSPNVPKYKVDNGIKIFVDDRIAFQAPGFNWYADDNPPPTASESYGIRELALSDFRKMANSRVLSVQIGPTRIEVVGEALDAVRDLLKTMETK